MNRAPEGERCRRCAELPMSCRCGATPTAADKPARLTPAVETLPLFKLDDPGSSLR